MGAHRPGGEVVVQKPKAAADQGWEQRATLGVVRTQEGGVRPCSAPEGLPGGAYPGASGGVTRSDWYAETPCGSTGKDSLGGARVGVREALLVSGRGGR